MTSYDVHMAVNGLKLKVSILQVTMDWMIYRAAIVFKMYSLCCVTGYFAFLSLLSVLYKTRCASHNSFCCCFSFCLYDVLVHFSSSMIHRTLTRSNGSLTCVCDIFPWVYISLSLHLPYFSLCFFMKSFFLILWLILNPFETQFVSSSLR